MDKEDVVHTMEYYSTIKKNEIMPLAHMMDLEIIILNKPGKDKYIISTLCGILEN